MPDTYDLGSYRRPVSTSSPEAQRWFDRGLLWCYAYNHGEAEACFRRAAEADPGCAMAHWGLAYVRGCNYNKPWAAFDALDMRGSVAAAYEATQAALGLRHKAPPTEAMLIGALRARYPQAEPVEDPARWNDDFAAAMREVYRQAPDDPDVATIFAEALMNRTPWQLWDIAAGTVAPGADTAEAIAVLERAMGLPGGDAHPGLLHMVLHLMEMSPYPERALPAANRLRGLVPDAGHLNHMPTHIDVLVGDYVSAIQWNDRAIAADRLYLAREGAMNFYSLYRCHNYHFKIYGAMFAGQIRPAIETADEMVSTLSDDLLRVASPPMADWLESFVSVRQHVLIRFGQWETIAAEPLPVDRTLYCVTTAMIAYAKAIAHGVLGDLAQAQHWAARFDEALAEVPPSRTLFNNTCVAILAVAREMMLGEVRYREARYDEAFGHLRRAVALDDGLPYDEPWGWMQPARHALGALLLEQGHVEEAAEVYRADLGLDPVLPRPCRHPDNIWSLRGYHECLIRLGRPDEAARLDAKLARLDALTDMKVEASCFCRRVGAE